MSGSPIIALSSFLNNIELSTAGVNGGR